MQADLLSLVPHKRDLSRRGFLKTTALATGFALAVRPVNAQTVITTDAEGLVVGEVQIPVEDGEIPGYRARPEGEGTFPVVLVVQEIFGIHEYIQDVCRRFAQLGYMAVAPDMYVRQGDVTELEDIQTIISEVVSQVPDEQVLSDLDATVAWAESTGHGDTDRLGITGFCWGGRIVWLYAAHNPDVSAGVAWYGRLVGETSDRTPQQPVDIAPDLTVPVLGLYGGQDDGIPLDTVEQMRQALAGSESGSEIVVYPEAPHGFHADYRPSYREEAAMEGWQQLQDWFEANGVA